VLRTPLPLHSFFQQVYLLLIKDSLFLAILVVAPTRFNHVHTVYKHDTPVNVIPVAVFPARGKPVNSCLGCTLISSPAGSQLKAKKSIVMARAAKSDMFCFLINRQRTFDVFQSFFSV